MSWVVPDFETASLCDLKKAGAWRYAEDVTTEVLCLSWCLGDGPITTWYPGDPLPTKLQACIEDDKCLFVAHNAGFEKAIWRRIMVPYFGWPDIPNRRWHDTAAKCAMLRVPTELEKVLGVFRLPVEKDMEGNKLTLSLSRLDKKTGMLPERTPEIIARVGQYCEVDVRGQRELHKRIGWMPEGERRVYLMDQEINERGLRLDMPLVRQMQQIVDKASVPLAKEFAELTGGLRMTQRDKVLSWMQDRGVWLPNMTKDTLAAVLGETDEGEEIEADERIHLDLPEDVHRALHIRQLIGSASIKKLTSMEACVGADGRARGLLRYHRAGPGRWAGTLLQPQNFPRGSLTEDGDSPNIGPLVDALMTGDPDYVEAIYGPPVEAVVSSLRYCVIAEPGHELVAGDYAGIEARVVLALAGQHDKTALMAAGADVYIDMAQDIFGHPKFDVTDKALCKAFKGAHLEDRQTGKNTVLGCGFQMGAPKFHDRYCAHQPMEFAEKVITTYRKVWAPKVPDLWHALENAAIRTVHDRRPHEAYGMQFAIEDEWLTIRLLSGRKLWYFDPRPIRKAMPWDEDDIRLAWTFRDTKTGRLVTVDAYGGLITENIVQALARDILVRAMFKCRNERLPIVLTVHDELVLELLAKGRDNEVLLQQIMEDVDPWVREIKAPISVEVWSNDRYKK